MYMLKQLQIHVGERYMSVLQDKCQCHVIEQWKPDWVEFRPQSRFGVFSVCLMVMTSTNNFSSLRSLHMMSL